MANLQQAPPPQDINSLYSLLNQNPKFLDDDKAFANTPLHDAAAQGRKELALEIFRLMPSLGRRLNPDGYSSIHLALQAGHLDTFKALLKVDPQLLCVLGREGITPLHYVIQLYGDNHDILTEILLRCPDSIEELTIRGESAVHVAVKSRNLGALGLLIRWLKSRRRIDVLGWRDLEGNTALHLAAQTNQSQAMKLLLMEGDGEFIVKEKNSEGKTALELASGHPAHTADRSALKMLKNREKRESGLLFNLSCHFRLNVKRAFRYGSMSSETRNAMLVVSVLVATATYQAVLNPPGGFVDGNQFTNSSSSMNNDGTMSGDGKVRMSRGDYGTFMLSNSAALATSLVMMLAAIPDLRAYLVVYVSLLYLSDSYLEAATVASPYKGTRYNWHCYIPCFAVAATYGMFLWRMWSERIFFDPTNYFKNSPLVEMILESYANRLRRPRR